MKNLFKGLLGKGCFFSIGKRLRLLFMVILCIGALFFLEICAHSDTASRVVQVGGKRVFDRDLSKALDQYATFPVIAILGPSQSGKTTFAQNAFPNHKYISFENPAIREFAIQDPEKFIREYENEYGLILDEIQYVPQLLSYIKLEVDSKKRPGYFVLTGSQNFVMNQMIAGSLVGRVAMLTLLPLSLHELKVNKLLPKRSDEAIIQGFYPRIFSDQVLPYIFYSAYIRSYIERDVRCLGSMRDLQRFQKFMALCAGRIGQLLNVSDIAMNCGISIEKASEWLSILEESYIIFLLPAHFKSFNKRLVKTPKLYFYDTGLACSLLGLNSAKELTLSSFRAMLFENMIISDLYKQYFNAGKQPPLYFWRDQNGRVEVDCLVDAGVKLFPIAVKASETIIPTFFDELVAWNKISAECPEDNTIVYAGLEKQTRKKGMVVGWQAAGDLIPRFNKIIDELGENQS